MKHFKITYHYEKFIITNPFWIDHYFPNSV
ncbi:hypothetical protein DEU40_1078 [Chryseobacterium sp. AG844]|nr:hypothetical protein DEU40_1078 [Chryseobacterium sp. AG844]